MSADFVDISGEQNEDIVSSSAVKDCENPYLANISS